MYWRKISDSKPINGRKVLLCRKDNLRFSMFTNEYGGYWEEYGDEYISYKAEDDDKWIYIDEVISDAKS